MLNDVFRRLDEAYPGLSRWLGGRLDVQVPAIGLSLLTHAVALVVFGMLTYAATTDRGTDCAVSLDRDEELVDGALLFIAPERAIIARFGEQEIWRLRAVDQAAALKLGWNAGNLHWRVRFEGDCLAVLLDAPLHTYRARIMPLLEAGEVEELGDV